VSKLGHEPAKVIRSCESAGIEMGFMDHGL